MRRTDMISFKKAGEVLDGCAERLPREIFKELNGGVNLLPDTRTDELGLLVMGMYIVDQTGRRVEIYYGSFAEAFGGESDETVERELDITLRHELTHHIESLAGDKSLERWDEQHKQELLSELEPIYASSVLFISGDDASLGPMVRAFFEKAARGRSIDVESGSAGLKAAAAVEPRCAAACADMGIDISSYVPKQVTGAILRRFDAVLCMTRDMAEELANMFPEADEKIMCLGETDYAPPKLGLRRAWASAAEKMRAEAELLAGELAEGDGNGG